MYIHIRKKTRVQKIFVERHPTKLHLQYIHQYTPSLRIHELHLPNLAKHGLEGFHNLLPLLI